MSELGSGQLLALAGSLANRAGRGKALGFTRLAGGLNNRVYRIETEHEPLVLKKYFTDPRDPRDRLLAEWSFLRHAWARGVRAISEPIACDEAAHAALYSFVPGRKLAASELALDHIRAAADFVVAVNAAPRAELAPASEACFSLAEHVATVERRVARLAALDINAPLGTEAKRFVTTILVPAWQAVKAQLAESAEALGLAMDRTLDIDACCLSPSDFGFHNALFEGGNLVFLDFEYAGRDDPAKLVSDFFCQPEIPVPMQYHAGFVEHLARGLNLDDAAVARCRMLLDTYRIKWVCIVLNEFLPLGAARRKFADEHGRAARCADQLAKAQAKIAEIAAAGL